MVPVRSAGFPCGVEGYLDGTAKGGELVTDKPTEREADFFEPVTFNWDNDIYAARMAARQYSEQTRPDEEPVA